MACVFTYVERRVAVKSMLLKSKVPLINYRRDF